MRNLRLNGFLEDVFQSGAPITTVAIAMEPATIFKLSLGVLVAVAVGVKLGKSI